MDLGGILRTTIDAVLPQGIYGLNGYDSIGTFPPLNNAKYGIIVSVYRHSTNIQILIGERGIAFRYVSQTNIGDWFILCSN